MIKEFVNNARQLYSIEWAESSDNYNKNGFYDWCLNSIKGKKRILEIGCGVGFSTLKIINDNHTIISIEENPFMLNFAEKNLSQSKIKFKSIRREKFVVTNPGYRVDYQNIHDSFDINDNVLIEGNILTDYKLQEWLLSKNSFDAIICWFMGIQGAIVANDDMRHTYKFNEYEPSKYRKCIQIFLFQLGDKILKEGGVINFIDRTQLFESEQQKILTFDTLKDAFGDLSTSIDLCYIDQLEIENPAKIKGVPIKATHNDKVIESGDTYRYALTTVIGVKKQ